MIRPPAHWLVISFPMPVRPLLRAYSLWFSLLFMVVAGFYVFGWSVSWLCLTGFGLAMFWFVWELARYLIALRPQRPNWEFLPDVQRAITEQPESEANVSLVYFLEEGRSPTVDSVRRCFERALEADDWFSFSISDVDISRSEIEVWRDEGGAVDSVDAISDEGELSAEEGEGGLPLKQFFVATPIGTFCLLTMERPYVENPAIFAKRIQDKRIRRAVEQHRAWLAVDYLDPDAEPAQVRNAYRLIGHLMAVLAGPDCLAIFHPDSQRCNEFDPALMERLASSDPLQVFSTPTFEPVIEVSDSDAEMQNAVQLAQREWPKFAAAFKKRQPGDENFLVKTEFVEGKVSEYMWFSVREIIGDRVRGYLVNDPCELTQIYRGAEVTITVDEVADWLHPRPEGGHAGGFSLDVLKKRKKE